MENIIVMEMVRKYIEENRMSKSSIARSLGTSPSAFLQRLSSPNMDCLFLLRLCRVTNHDFFADVSELMGMPKEKSDEIKALEMEIEILKRERDLLKGIILGEQGSKKARN